MRLPLLRCSRVPRARPRSTTSGLDELGIRDAADVVLAKNGGFQHSFQSIISHGEHDFASHLVGDYNPNVIAHQAIPRGFAFAGESLGQTVKGVWMHTSSLTNPRGSAWRVRWHLVHSRLSVRKHGRRSGGDSISRGNRDARFWALAAASSTRCLNMLVMSVDLRMLSTQRSIASAALPLISPLSCPLVEKIGEMFLDEGSLIRKAYGEARILEGFHCSYGLNRDYSPVVLGKELRATAHDADGEVRAVELTRSSVLCGHAISTGTKGPVRRGSSFGSGVCGFGHWQAGNLPH